MKYDKPALTFEKQIELLESRGLTVKDKARATDYLSNISYYRLSAYMLSLKMPGKNRFQPFVSFDDVLHLYLFDREYRLLIFDAIERIEIAFRTQMSYQLSHDGGPFWFEDRNYFRDADRWREHLDSMDTEVGRAKEVFKDHFFHKYDEHERMPIWMTSEVLSFGLLSKVYRNLRMSDGKKRIARRLWNRILTVRPVYLERPTNIWISHEPDNQKAYYFTCCVLYLLRSINPKTRFVAHLRSLLERYPKLQPQAMGFTSDWDGEKFWR